MYLFRKLFRKRKYLSLPADIWLNILVWVDDTTLCALFTVNKTLYHLSTNEYLWKLRTDYYYSHMTKYKQITWKQLYIYLACPQVKSSEDLIRANDLDRLKLKYIIYEIKPDQYEILTAARLGRLQIVKWMLRFPFEYEGERDEYYEIIKHTKYMFYLYDIVTTAINFKQKKIIKFFLDHYTDTIKISVMMNRCIEFRQYYIDKIDSLRSRHQSCFKYIYNKTSYLDNKIIERLIYTDNHDLFRWLLKRGAKIKQKYIKLFEKHLLTQADREKYPYYLRVYM